MADEQRATETPSERAAWEKPAFYRIGADEAETGILFGPEILILLS